MSQDNEELVYAIQVKTHKATALRKAYSEAKAAAGAFDYDPIGVSRETINGRREWVAAIPLSLLVELIGAVEFEEASYGG